MRFVVTSLSVVGSAIDQSPAIFHNELVRPFDVFVKIVPHIKVVSDFMR